MKLFFYTETTGKAEFRLPPNHPRQPRLIQLCAILTNDHGDEVSAVNLLVKPDGFSIPDEAAAVHGIETDFALAHRLPVKAAVSMFVYMARAAESLHAFNADYDRIVMEGEIMRCVGMPNPFADPSMALRCEMKAMTVHCKLPGRFGGDYKWPSLSEAHTHAIGKPHEDAHDALGDVRAMIAVHKWRIAQPPPQEMKP